MLTRFGLRVFQAAFFTMIAQGVAVFAADEDQTASRGTTLDQTIGEDDPWTITHDVSLVSRWPTSAGAMRDDKIVADLYRPNQSGRGPAAVIINSSGGVQPHTELYYARVFARQGIASLVIDSFTPRGVLRTGDDQARVWQVQSDADAVAGFRWLAAQPWVDPQRIIIVGMSRGGVAALATVLEQYRGPLQAADIRFAAHVAITTGGCNLPPRDAKTTGAPIFLMEAELDDGTPFAPCLELADRMRAAGNTNVRVAVYPGVYHAFEYPGGISFATKDETGRKCAGRYFQDRARALFERSTGKAVASGRERQFLLESCIERGYTVGGDARVNEQATADLLQFLRDAEVIIDTEARAVVPDCATVPDGIYRRNCVRARNGWSGDIVALARAFRNPGGIARNDGLAARLFQLAADRGNAKGKWELAQMLRQGEGVARDVPKAIGLLKSSAAAGESAAMNILGLMARDGIGRGRDDAEAVGWFRKGADLRNEYSLDTLGMMYRQGRGELATDKAEVVTLFRLSAFLGNPWGRLHLAEVLETGEGTERNLARALDLYRQAASQDREPAAKRRAQEALNRLTAVPAEKSREAADHSVSTSSERRLALVIGNSNYTHIGPIPNPRNDAEDMAKLLKGLGFEVTLGIDLKRADMEDTLIRFARDIRSADTALVFYAGHGIQHQGVNYLAPIDARIEDETDLRKLINLQAMIDDLQSASRIRILLIDACRDNKGVQQLNAKLPKATREAALTRGLARIDSAEGTLVVFATQPNRVAADGKGRNSPFAQALLKHLPTPGVEIRTLLTRVRADVVASTSDKQRPELYDSLVGEFVLNTGAGAQPAATQVAGLPSSQSAPGPSPSSSPEARPTASATISPLPSPAAATSPLHETLVKRLAAYAVPANDIEREVRFFEAGGAHKAIAVSPETHHAARSVGWATSAAAEIGALEACQLLWAKPCALLVVDDKVETPNQGSPTVRDMPRTRYAGLFEPEQIPRIRPETVRRADVVGYRSAPEPKAAAFHIQGNFFIVTGAASQAEAEEQALAKCNDDPVRKGADGPCWLYAVGNQVMLPQRSVKPLSHRQTEQQQPQK
jgi:uncharacterized caspase-like protein/TPR repeat protein